MVLSQDCCFDLILLYFNIKKDNFLTELRSIRDNWNSNDEKFKKELQDSQTVFTNSRMVHSCGSPLFVLVFANWLHKNYKITLFVQESTKGDTAKQY